ncbi:[acyl-carrier-protein] S-malonyltransferase [Ahniella affigens]|uniref:Malonyl CoA-acyl carrier protein transacylase n=1 Tax=Ahniella affigens TaxID=2021234 RepID=A0A2P1PPH8_9GAMM|nr:ACP S-malonyltransferase [Ahniella affigens]AVP96753.1 [acyl-carrier-protein] S-malonyltransferase [Ahniella affigens]
MSQSFAFVFPGQGSQRVGMLADFALQHALIRQTFDEASAGCGLDLWTLSQDGPDTELNRTEVTQPALLAASVALWRLWTTRSGAKPSLLAGHSLGEYSALVAAEALSLADAAKLVRDRGRLMQEAVPAGTGGMAAVLMADDALIAEACRDAAQGDVVQPANFNAPGQTVISGSAAAVERAMALLTERGVKKIVKLAVSVPSHSLLMKPAAEALAPTLRGLNWQLPTIPVVQNADARAHNSLDAIQDALIRQLYAPVRWTECVQQIAGQGVSRFAECGPEKVLTGLFKRIDKSLEARALSVLADFETCFNEWSAA